ncbi:MAG: hypothetical protein VX777_01655 [Chlamydiota bacterium]|nr:hypothetical protein [Chlamydiota bacterium]
MFERIQNLFRNKDNNTVSTEEQSLQKSQDATTEIALKSLSSMEDLSGSYIEQDFESNKMSPIEEPAKSTGLCGKICDYAKSLFYSWCKGTKSKKLVEIQQAMKAIGGEPLNLKNSKGDKIDGMFFGANNLVEKMQSSGMKRVTITKNQSQEKLSAFVFDLKNPKTNELLNSFTQMGLFKLEYNNKDNEKIVISEGVWDKHIIDGKVYIFTKENKNKLIKNCSPFKGGKFNLANVTVSEPFNTEFSQKEPKTIVLSGGLSSHFESAHTAIEVAKFVALGFNVVVSENKNAKVIDSESHENVMANMKAIIKDLENRGIENHDVILKGNCQGSLASVEAAANHPGMHVIIDQGYYDSADMLSHKLVVVPKVIASKMCDAVDFRYSMEDYLGKVDGKVMVIRNNNDGKVPVEQHQKMVDKLKGKEGVKFFSINDKKIGHAGSFFKDEACNREITDYLMECGFSQGDILS